MPRKPRLRPMPRSSQSRPKALPSLNLKYGDGRDDVFFLFHRPRRYNASEGIWMGEERKRGKLAALNAFLRGDTDSHFSLVVGDYRRAEKRQVCDHVGHGYAVAAGLRSQLVATMMHPLNQPIYDSVKKRVVEGYGILQPRVAGTPVGGRSLTLRKDAAAGKSGWIPIPARFPTFTRTCSAKVRSSVRESMTSTRSSAALKHRLPDNRILSHDLLEGCYARSGLVSDVQLYEDDPASYFVDMSSSTSLDTRRLANSELGYSAAFRARTENQRAKSTVAAVAVEDPRQLAPQPRAAGVGRLADRGLDGTHAGNLLDNSDRRPGGIAPLPRFSRPPGSSRTQCRLEATILRGAGRTAFQRFAQTIFALSCLPFEAFSGLDAIVRTTIRTLVTKRRLLQWTATGDLARRNRGVAASYRQMWSAPAIALCASIAILYFRPSAFWVAAPLLVLWMCAPAYAWWLSRPVPREQVRLSRKQLDFLRLLARKTWAFFETMVNAGDNWLPPDNFQEIPAPVIAHRTSPTNIGMSLLATLAAHDFGYATTGVLLSRTRRTFETLQRLERYRGHFFNWYDTQTLQPLNPRYVSTVDSGNLAGHLLVLRQGLLALAQAAADPARWFAGFADTVAVLREEFADKEVAGLTALEGDIQRALADRALSPTATREHLHRIAARVGDCGEDADGSDHAGAWLGSLRSLCTECLVELDLLAPWNALQSPPPRLVPFFDVGFCPTLRDLAGRVHGVGRGDSSMPGASIQTRTNAYGSTI